VDASEHWQYKGTEGEGRGYGIKKWWVHLDCHKPKPKWFPLLPSYFKPTKFKAEHKATFKTWMEAQNAEAPNVALTKEKNKRSAEETPAAERPKKKRNSLKG